MPLKNSLLALLIVVAALALYVPRALAPELLWHEPKAVVLFGGDMMFDRSIRQYSSDFGGDYLFGCIDALLREPDLVVANLEGPITPERSLSLGSAPGSARNYVFTFPTSTAALLYKHHIEVVNIGNNHIENFGEAGVRSTIKALTEAGVGYFGDPLHNSVLRKNVGGVKLSFITFNEFLPLGVERATTTVAQIAQEVAAGRVPVVYTHWGVEYARQAPQYVALAHSFVDVGAVAVIGSHPHVVQQTEVYKNAPIYYSLGNFIFDQYFSSDVAHGLLVELAVTARGASVVREIPTSLTPDRRVCAQL